MASFSPSFIISSIVFDVISPPFNEVLIFGLYLRSIRIRLVILNLPLHYNEPPIGKVILKGKVIGDRYRRCYFTNQKLKQENINHKENFEVYQTEIENSKTDRIVRELNRHIDERRPNFSKEDEIGKDYKKLYLDLIEKLKKILYDIKTSTLV
jgi:hypothetical protein